MNEAEIKEALLALRPGPLHALGEDWLQASYIKSLELSEHLLKLEIQLPYPIADIQQTLSEILQTELQRIVGVPQVELKLEARIVAHTVGSGIKAVDGVKNIIAVASGKGGVGKSTTTVNLALALAKQGARVGILDADIYGPNQPHMLGAENEILAAPSGALLQPRNLHGVQSMSMGYLVDMNTPMVWRGPMVSSALQQLLQQTEWQDLDYLLIDLPPGTGDIQLTLSQKVPVTAAIIVTTPQDISLLDARKGLEMFRKVKVPILGIIENMSMHTCSACGHQEAIFGEGGGERLSGESELSLLGQLPLSKAIRVAADAGTPSVVSEPEGEAARLYHQIARVAVAKLARQGRNYTVKFPRIVIE